MKPSRALSLLLLTLLGGALASGPGCGTDARGVETCRRIEQARCEAAPACGLISDVSACSRFYRDHCLHGLVAREPSAVRAAECETAIREAGSCAAAPEDDTSACPPGLDPSSACRAIEHPERLAACAFLDPSPDAGSGGSGGQPAEEPPPSRGGSGGAPESSAGAAHAQGGAEPTAPPEEGAGGSVSSATGGTPGDAGGSNGGAAP